MFNSAFFKQLKGEFSTGGLDLTTKPDGSEFSLVKFGGYQIGKAPDSDFRIPGVPPTKDQKRTDFCVAYQGSYTVEQDEINSGIPQKLAACFNFAAARKRYYAGRIDTFGLGIKQGLGSLQHDGISLDKYYPNKKSRNYLANWKNVPAIAWQDASTRKMTKGFFIVDVYKDQYENFMAALWHWKEMIITGLTWYDGFKVDSKGRLIMNKTGGGVGHCVSIIEKKTIDGVRGCVCKNSWKNNSPEFWVSEDQIRKEFYFGFIVLPFDLPIVKIIQKYAGKAIMSDVEEKKEVYLVIDGKKCWLPNEFVAWAYDVHLWNDVVKIPDSDLASIPQGENLDPTCGQNYKIMKEIFSLSSSRFIDLKKHVK